MPVSGGRRQNSFYVRMFLLGAVGQPTPPGHPIQGLGNRLGKEAHPGGLRLQANLALIKPWYYPIAITPATCYTAATGLSYS